MSTKNYKGYKIDIHVKAKHHKSCFVYDKSGLFLRSFHSHTDHTDSEVKAIAYIDGLKKI